MRSAKPLFILDGDDPDLHALQGAVEFDWMQTGLESSWYSLNWLPGGGWDFGTPSMTVNQNTFSRAGAVWYRRWRTAPPVPIVRADSDGDPAHASFVERQWDATLRPLLQLEFEAAPDRWSCAPMSGEPKVRTMALLTRLGLAPATVVGLSAPTDRRERVWKAIHDDQSYGDQRVGTIDIDLSDAGVRQPCPGFYQARIHPEVEVRAGYAFGAVGLVAQWPLREVDFADKRYVDMRREAIDEPLLAEQVRRVASALELNVFTADILKDEAGTWWWCDVNPAGLFCAADSPDGHLIETLADGLVARAATAGRVA